MARVESFPGFLIWLGAQGCSEQNQHECDQCCISMTRSEGGNIGSDDKTRFMVVTYDEGLLSSVQQKQGLSPQATHCRMRLGMPFLLEPCLSTCWSRLLLGSEKSAFPGATIFLSCSILPHARMLLKTDGSWNGSLF